MSIFVYVVPACLAAIVSCALTPLAGWIAERVGALDQPGPRKIHHRPIPRLGGLAVIAAAVLVSPIFLVIPAFRQSLNVSMCLGVALGLVPIVVVSILDDIKTLKAGPKFLLHVAGAVIAVSFGVSLNSHVHLFGLTLNIGFLAFPLSVLWIVGVTNAFNIVDGLDGLSAGLALISSASLAGVFVFAGESETAAGVLVVAGSLVGFLPRNVYPARMFLGDTGATAVGFCLAAFALKGGSTLSAGFATMLPVFALGMPIIETGLSMTRRIVRRFSQKDAGGVFDADRNHMHHRLLALGIDHAHAVFILYAAGLVLASGALLSMYMNARESMLLLLALFLAGVLGIRRLEYDEFAVIRNGAALRVYEAPVLKRSMFVVFVDILNVAIAVYCAVGLKTDDWNLALLRTSALARFALLAPITVVVFSRMGLYRGSWRLAGIEEFTRASCAVVIATLLGFVARMILTPAQASPSFLAIYALLMMVLVIGSRASYQILVASQTRARHAGQPVLIYGAGRRGAGALRELLFDGRGTLRPVGFIDDDPDKAGRMLNGVPIIGSIHALEPTIRRFAAQAVVVATEGIPDVRLADIRACCERLGVSLLRMQVRFDQCLTPAMAVSDELHGWPPRFVESSASSVAPIPATSPLPATVTAGTADGLAPAPAPAACQRCGSSHLHRSHARTPVERIQKRLSRRRLYRCDACGWRGWSELLEAAVFEPAPAMGDKQPLLEAVDAVLQ